MLSYAYDKNKPNKEDADIFKKFIQRIIEAENREDAMQNVFYGNDGIDIAFQREKMGYLEQDDIPTDKKEIIADIRKVRTVAPKFYNMMMCMCNCEERSNDNDME